jgi:hypothetical protein
MRKWNFKVSSKPSEITKALESALESVGGFVFKKDHVNNDSAVFSFRKRAKYPDQILHRNRMIVNGKISKSNTEVDNDVEITFTQHFFMKMAV